MDRELAVSSGLFWRAPPSITEFIEDEYWLGAIGATLYDYWKKQAQVLHPSPFYSPYNTVIIQGSQGGGKTNFTCLSIAYELAVFLCRNKPHEQFGFSIGEPINIALCNSTLTLSNDVQLQKFFGMIDSSPFFQEQRAKYAQTHKPSKEELALNLPYQIKMMAGSASRQLVGRAILSVAISELNQMSREQSSQAINLFVESRNRLFTRFNRGDFLSPPGKLYMESSAKTCSSNLDQLAEILKDQERTLIIEDSYWNYVKGGPRDNFSGERFWCFKGSPNRDAHILDGTPEEANVPESLCLDVPIELLQEFKFSVVDGLRDFGGIAVSSASNFIGSIEAINEALVLQNPVSRDVIELDMDSDADRLLNYIDLTKLSKDVPLYVHADLSKNKDRTGVGFTCVSGTKEIEWQSEHLTNQPPFEVGIWCATTYDTDLR